ncbi:hypothetical protein FQN60_016492 [Etheostoma spectabile]|uniref:RING-type E3 ubiquitin transferase n=1 Tax=Etheostoma spectabile TaxID=54343 RepID=A0A5J5D431_9PERO|nr:hypothetical protein FQN60_016492 [Etheostoma spectabile]
MNTEEGEAGAACGETRGEDTGITDRHTWDGGEPLDRQGRRHPEDEDGAPKQAEDREGCREGRGCRGAGEGSNGGNFSSEEGAVGGASCKEQTMHSNCSSETCIPTPSCRICFQGAEQGDLLNPCRCDGSVRYTHQHCLLKWISERGCWTCELCCYRFHWQSITITLVEKVQIIAVFLGSLFLVASISWLLWSTLSPQAIWQRRDILFQICYGMGRRCTTSSCAGGPSTSTGILRATIKQKTWRRRAPAIPHWSPGRYGCLWPPLGPMGT